MRAARLLAGILGLLAGTSRAVDSVPKESGAPEQGGEAEEKEEKGFNRRFQLGALVGPNFATFSTTQSDSYKTQLTGGILLEAQLLRYFAVQSEIRYANISAGWASLDSLGIPLYFKGVIPTGTFLGFHGQVGPEVYLMLSSRVPDSSLSLNPVVFALGFGGGIDAEVARRVTLFSDFRYVLGLTDVADDVADRSADSKPRELQLLLGVKYRL